MPLPVPDVWIGTVFASQWLLVEVARPSLICRNVMGRRDARDVVR